MKLVTYNVFKSRRPGLGGQLNHLVKSSDVVLVQEWVSSLGKLDEYCYEENFTFTTPIRRRRTGTCTISKNEHKTLESIKLVTKKRELGFTTKKSAIVTTLKIAGRQCVVVNLHSINFVLNRVWKKELLHILEHLPEDLPVIFAGDFNTWNAKRLSFLEQTMRQYGFSSLDYKRAKKLKLDHIFYRGLKINSCQYLTEITDSDHHPIAVDFDFL